MIDTAITNETVLKLNSKILKRYEHNLKGGTMILFNLDTEDIWLGNSSSRNFIDLLDGKNNIQDIYVQILSNYQETEYDKVINALNALIEDLYTKKFIEIVYN